MCDSRWDRSERLSVVGLVVRTLVDVVGSRSRVSSPLHVIRFAHIALCFLHAVGVVAGSSWDRSGDCCCWCCGTLVVTRSYVVVYLVFGVVDVG